ncbi:CHAT domain-containing protein [Streptomyces sp. MAI_2237]
MSGPDAFTDGSTGRPADDLLDALAFPAFSSDDVWEPSAAALRAERARVLEAMASLHSPEAIDDAWSVVAACSYRLALLDEAEAGDVRTAVQDAEALFAHADLTCAACAGPAESRDAVGGHTCAGRDTHIAWQYRRTGYAHLLVMLAAMEDRPEHLERAHGLLSAVLENPAAVGAADDGSDDSGAGDEIFVRRLMARVCTLRYWFPGGEETEPGLCGRRALLDEAIRRCESVFDLLEEDDPDGAQVHADLGDLLLDRCIATGDPEDLRDAERAVRQLRTALAAGDRNDGFVLNGLGWALLLLGRCREDADVVREALDVMARARSAGAPLPDEEEAFARCLLWSTTHCNDRPQAPLVEALVEPLLDTADALEELPPYYVDVFARVLYEQAVARNDDTRRDRCLALLEHALEHWDEEDDGDPSAALLTLSSCQLTRFGNDHEPARLFAARQHAERLAARPDAIPGIRRLALCVAAAAHNELARLGLAEPDPERTELFVRAYQETQREIDEGTTFVNHNTWEVGALVHDVGGAHRLADGFAEAYRRWRVLDRADPQYAMGAAAILMLVADHDGDSPATTEQVEELHAAAMGALDGADWQATVGLMAGTARLRGVRGAGARRSYEAALRHLDRAGVDLGDSVGSSGRTADQVSMARAWAVLGRGAALGGVDDIEEALAELRSLRTSPTLTGYQRSRLDAQIALLSVRRAVALGDLGTADRALRALGDAYAATDPEDPHRISVWSSLENARIERDVLAERLGRPRSPRPAGAPTPGELKRLAARLPTAQRATVLADNGVRCLTEAAERNDTRRLDEAEELLSAALAVANEGGEQWVRCACALGSALNLRFLAEKKPEVLNAGIEWLIRARERAGGPEHPMWALTGLALGRSLRTRADWWRITGSRADADRAQARLTGLAALRGHAWAALTQSGTDHATEVAVHATDAALEVVEWSIQDECPQDAVRALDACRALVLHAALTSLSVPDRLTAAGHPDLAAEWRVAEATTTAAAPVRQSVPSELRRRALTALATPPEATASHSVPAPAGPPPLDPLLDPPSVEEIGGALRVLGLDALAYLLASDDDRGGTAVVVTRDGRAHALALPLLRSGAAPLRAFLPERPAAGAGRDLGPVSRPSARTGPTRLRDQLDRLGSWTWFAAVKPLLEALGMPERTPRVVLVPMGALGGVPWHAAWEPAGQGRRHYAVQRAEISYTASARLLCDLAARPAVRPDGPALVVGDPTGDLPYAGEEAQAVWRSFYAPAAHGGSSAGSYLGRGATADDVLAWLRSPDASGGILHLACHGVVTEGRGRTARLSLSGGELSAEALAETAGERLALVLLAACRSHVSGRGHNEAYTLATAFLVSGAASVIGSLWPVPDDATSVLMYLTHHFLRRERLGPQQALRRAQLWMLDPHRVLPAGMPAALRERALATDLHDPTAWAGFTHLGRL